MMLWTYVVYYLCSFKNYCRIEMRSFFMTYGVFINQIVGFISLNIYSL